MTVGTGSSHVILEYWGVSPSILKDRMQISKLLKKAAKEGKAHILHSHFHHFGSEYGVTGIVVLAESHISIHTWPEEGYAAVDIFMCGNCNPLLSANYLQKILDAKSFHMLRLERGNEEGIILR